MYNMQSGIRRKAFNIGPCPSSIADRLRVATTSKRRVEERCVTGLASDPLNRTVIASTLDGTLNVSVVLGLKSDGHCLTKHHFRWKFFDFHTASLEETVILPSAAVSIVLHSDSGLLAVICDDLVVRIVDIETRRVVRELTGFRSHVLDLVGTLPYRILSRFPTLLSYLDIRSGWSMARNHIAGFHHPNFRYTDWAPH